MGFTHCGLSGNLGQDTEPDILQLRVGCWSCMTPKMIVTFCNRYPTEGLEGYDDWTA
jgi:hypothetical protein